MLNVIVINEGNKSTNFRLGSLFSTVKRQMIHKKDHIEDVGCVQWKEIREGEGLNIINGAEWETRYNIKISYNIKVSCELKICWII